MVATRLRCEACGTAVEGRFDLGLASLGGEDQAFARAFLLARGNLRELERTLGLGYAALRGRLDAVVARLERSLADEAVRSGSGASVDAGPHAVLDALEAGEIDAAEATRRLSELDGGDDDRSWR